MSKEARVAALEALYAADATGGAPNAVGLSSRARRLVEGVTSERPHLDETLAAASRGWRLERMPMVDRSILRLALYELVHTDTPTAVVIDEAVELAKTYSTARSGRFVNGVLGTLAGEVRGEVDQQGSNGPDRSGGEHDASQPVWPE